MKNFFSGLKQKLGSMYSKNKKMFVVLMALVLVVVVCFLFYPKTSTKTSKEDKQEIITDLNIQDYSSKIEKKVKDMLLSLDEVTRANVMVVCDSTEIVEYQKNSSETSSDNSTTKTEEIAYEKDGSKNTPIIICTKFPKIVGIWVIINTVSPSTKLAITNSICSVLNIEETSINILQER